MRRQAGNAKLRQVLKPWRGELAPLNDDRQRQRKAKGRRSGEPSPVCARRVRKNRVAASG
jgi:hypothetical protein